MLTDVGSTPMIQTGNGGLEGQWGMMWWGFLIFALLGWGDGGFGGRRNNGAADTSALLGALNNQAASATQADVFHAQEMSDLNGRLGGIRDGLSDLGFGLQNAMNANHLATINEMHSNAIASMQQSQHNEVQNMQNAFQLDSAIKDNKFATTAGIAALDNSMQRGITQSTYELAQKSDGIKSAIADCCCTTQRSIDATNFNMERNTAAIVAAIQTGNQRILDTMCANEKAALAEKLNAAERNASELRIIAAMKPQAPVPAYAVANPYTGGSYVA